MMIFPRVHLYLQRDYASLDYLSLSITHVNSTETTWRALNTTGQPRVRVFQAVREFVVTTTTLALIGGSQIKFKMLFSFHAEPDIPVLVTDNLFNCSVNFYPTFQQHLHCNLQRECSDARDETEWCPFSSSACPDEVASEGKCYFLVGSQTGTGAHEDRFSWNQASLQCRERGARLATITTPQQQEDVSVFWNAGRTVPPRLYVGLKIATDGVAFMYRNIMHWISSKSIVYKLSYETIFPEQIMHPVYCGLVRNALKGDLTCSCKSLEADQALCERDITNIPTLHSQLHGVAPSQLRDRPARQDQGKLAKLKRCPKGH
jgi:hypothetical protein